MELAWNDDDDDDELLGWKLDETIVLFCFALLLRCLYGLFKYLIPPLSFGVA